MSGDVHYAEGSGAGCDVRKKKVRRRSSKSIKDASGSQTAYKNAIHVIGDRWTANLIALAYHGIRRFDEFHKELPIATNVLSNRLKFLIREGIFDPVPYSERPRRLDYRLSAKGLALFSAVAHLKAAVAWYASLGGWLG